MLSNISQQAKRTVAFIASDWQSDDAIKTLLQIRIELGGIDHWPQNLKGISGSWIQQSTQRSDNPIWRDVKHILHRA
jgi:hypothetical protein